MCIIMPDLIKLGWMPIKEGRENHLLSTVFKALHYNDLSSYLKLDIHNATRTLRSLSRLLSRTASPMFLVHYPLLQGTL